MLHACFCDIILESKRCRCSEIANILQDHGENKLMYLNQDTYLKNDTYRENDAVKHTLSRQIKRAMQQTRTGFEMLFVDNRRDFGFG